MRRVERAAVRNGISICGARTCQRTALLHYPTVCCAVAQAAGPCSSSQLNTVVHLSWCAQCAIASVHACMTCSFPYCINAGAHCRTLLHSGCGGEVVSSSSAQGALPSAAAAAGLHSWAAAADASAGSRQPSGHDGPSTCGPRGPGSWASQRRLPAGRCSIHTSSGLCCWHPLLALPDLRGHIVRPVW